MERKLPKQIEQYQKAIESSNSQVIGAISKLNEDLSSYYQQDDKEIALYIDSKKVASTTAKAMDRQLNILARRRDLSAIS